MARAVVWTERAWSDLDRAADYIARDNPVRALSFVRELYERCLDIAEMPEAWPIVPRRKNAAVTLRQSRSRSMSAPS